MIPEKVVCSPVDALQACWQRMRAVRDGDLAYAWNGGWRYNHPISLKWERVLRCPWCEGTLPTISTTAARLETQEGE